MYSNVNQSPGVCVCNCWGQTKCLYAHLQLFNLLIWRFLFVCELGVDLLFRLQDEPKRERERGEKEQGVRKSLGRKPSKDKHAWTHTGWLSVPQLSTSLEKVTHIRPTPSYIRVVPGNEAISVCVRLACFFIRVNWSICKSASLAFCCVSIILAWSSAKACAHPDNNSSHYVDHVL